MDTRPMTPAGLKPKDLVGIPWRVAFALQADGWYLRSDIIWAKPNPMPESVTDRPTKAHEYLFLLSKSERYFYDAEAVKEDAVSANQHNFTGQGYAAPRQTPNTGNRGRSGNKERKQRPSADTLNIGAQAGSIPWEGFKRNRRSVWTIGSEPFKGAHFAVMPRALVAPCILAGCPEGGVTLDPFAGSGTVGIVALEHNRKFIGIELNPAYAAMACKRMAAIPEPLPFKGAV
jgi:DNA modification methylase